ncbi:uncharacterized protein N7446_009088 [Penicillium canescens]|uniref:Uncharacterized protein n=1 Tax=Penicillium canescens TaxID=5083 RepID=A0AAD6I5W1_PENCN|nr:uncharacterized protein N7446_009088 [Penicillium canescens]KAJ6034339.1 hypothetical protein N7460_008514 [Penicillium canescens]KAJ6046001.1 hypothetical protein N7444_007255 [Penicillium canescens]KAJ6053076.1 hypothetical protein N7446_009088 [Penicillium canescens]
MARILENAAAFQWYCDQGSSATMNLPPWALPTSEDGAYTLYVCETFCRVPGCPKEAPETSTNNLRKHYKKFYLTSYPLVSGGGRRTLLTEREALRDFYQPTFDAYNAQQAVIAATQPVVLPLIPLRRDGHIAVTEMIRQLRQDLGKAVPCVPCRDASMTKGCCHTTRFGSCEHFDEFDISAWTHRPKDDEDEE